MVSMGKYNMYLYNIYVTICINSLLIILIAHCVLYNYYYNIRPLDASIFFFFFWFNISESLFIRWPLYIAVHYCPQLINEPFSARTFMRSSKIILEPWPCISEFHPPRRDVYFNNNIVSIYIHVSQWVFYTFHPVQFKIYDVKLIKKHLASLIYKFSGFFWVTRIFWNKSYVKWELSVSSRYHLYYYCPTQNHL